jgi:hypothetical protein
MLANQNAKLTGPDQGFLVSPLVLIRKPWEQGWAHTKVQAIMWQSHLTCINAKENYYQLKAEGTREINPAKWYKTVYELAAANDCNSEPPAGVAADLAKRLQQSFTKPWQNANPTEIPIVAIPKIFICTYNS